MTISTLIQIAFKQKASDLHLSPGLPAMMRVNGDLITMNAEVISTTQLNILLNDLLSQKQQEELKKNFEIDFALTFPSIGRCRANVFNQVNGLAAVFRLINSAVPTLDDFNMPSIFKELLKLSQGLILITGPTGSGKSTTLAAMINHINETYAYHIITIEDPIEFIYQSKKSLINQREVHCNTKNVETALRSALREDPDVILLGEMRDQETIQLALTAAETGHLVLSTLHTSDAARTIHRIVDVFPANEKNMIRNMLSQSIQAIISQTLIKSISGERIAAFEILIATPAIRHLIREDKISQIYSVLQTNHEIGMCTLDQYLQGLVSREMILPSL